jgi:lipopolysaccharide transport system permease protein
VRYKQTVLGILWAILRPFLTMVVFSIFFGHFAQMPSEGIPYPIFIYTALLPWQLFANSLTASGSSLIMNQGLITKVYFPRLIIPLSAIFVGVVDFVVAFIVLLGMMYYYAVVPTLAIFTLPLFIILVLAAALAMGLWLSALNVKYRDVQLTIPFLTQLWLFATPIAYPTSLIPEKWQLWYGLNPMVGVVEGFRWALLGQSGYGGYALIISILITGVLLVGGLIYFNHMEKTFADVV